MSNGQETIYTTLLRSPAQWDCDEDIWDTVNEILDNLDFAGYKLS